MLRTTLSISLLVAIPVGDARAEVDRCATADADLAWTATDLATWTGDTGWFPSGYVAQLRVSGRVEGHTTVATGVRTSACWDDQMQASLGGRPGTGWLDVAYGAQLSLRGRIHTSVLGQAIDWESDIPLPHVPMDLLLAGQRGFDPAIDAAAVTRVTDGTSPITLLSSDVIGDLISIVGISGGLRISVVASMTTSYHTSQATIAGIAITSPTAKVTLSADGPHGFGAGLEVPVAAEGVVRYEPSLEFNAGFDVKILGYRIVDWTFLRIPMSLPAIERSIQLTGPAGRLALPVLEGLGEGARMDFASGTVQELRVKNFGEAPLAIAPQTAPAGALVSRLDIPPGGEDTLRVFVADDAAFANGNLDLTLATNDPDRGSIVIQLGKDVGGTDPGLPPEEAAAAGCAAGGSRAPGVGMLLGFLAVLGRRRRR